MGHYRKKPVVIEAQHWDGTAAGATPIINWILRHGGVARYHSPVDSSELSAYLMIAALEDSNITASPGDWVIKGIQNEFYPCKPDIFAATYEPVSVVRNLQGDISLDETDHETPRGI